MQPLIAKFGGSSLSNSEKFIFIAKKIASLKKINPFIVVVLSAPYDITDNLISLSDKFIENKREKDALLSCGEQISITLMAMALNKIGINAISLNAFQAGIYTDNNYGNAKIIDIKIERIKKEIKNGYVVLITGFQGITKNKDFTTLGRGGSDLSAVCLAKYLNAKTCHIYSDVQGVYTANPSLVPEAKKIDKISYDEIIKLSENGSEVRQLKAIEYAKKNKIDIYLASTFSNEKGTLITEKTDKKPEITCMSIKKEGNNTKIILIGKYINDINNLKENIFKIAKIQKIKIISLKLSNTHIEINTKSDISEFFINLHREFIK